MSGPVQTVLGGFAIAWVCGGLLTAVLPTQEIRHLDLARLEYSVINGQGVVLQQVVASTSTPIAADWSASITRPGIPDKLLCSGYGKGIYGGEVNRWDLDTWTGDDCPDVAEVGDIFEVSWTHKNEIGAVVSIGGQFRLDAQGVLTPVNEVTE